MCESIGHRPLRGRCPAPPSTSTTTYLGRAWVPLTILRFCDYSTCAHEWTYKQTNRQADTLTELRVDKRIILALLMEVKMNRPWPRATLNVYFA